MAAPIFIQLTPDEDAPLQQLLNTPNTHPKVRRRALAVRLSAQHWSAPRIAQCLGCHQVPVLNDLKRWQQRRYARFADGKAHGAPKITPAVKAHLATLQDFRRCFARWLACGLRMRYLPRYSPDLNGMETVWRRVEGGLVLRCYYADVALLRAAVVAGLKQLGVEELKI